jgi:hypothetical protein
MIEKWTPLPDGNKESIIGNNELKNILIEIKRVIEINLPLSTNY